MDISYSFTCGRIETVFRIMIKIDMINSTNEVDLINRFRNDIFNQNKKIEDTELYTKLEKSDNKIIINRLKRIKKENKNVFETTRYQKDYQKGAWHELEEYKLAVRLNAAKDLIEKKYLERTGMNLTSRDFETLLGFNSANLRNMFAHKRDISKNLVEKFENFAQTY